MVACEFRMTPESKIRSHTQLAPIVMEIPCKDSLFNKRSNTLSDRKAADIPNPHKSSETASESPHQNYSALYKRDS